MLEKVVTSLIGLLGGVAVGTQAPIAGAMGERVGGLATSLIIHAGGALVSGALLLLQGSERLAQGRQLPWYMLGCGALGVVLYATISHTVPRLGATPAIGLIIVGQLLVGLAVDHFGLLGVPIRPLDATRVLSAALLVVGGYLAVR
jgi:transporter family-2 protein